MSKIIFFHQGADEYGSDKILALVASNLAKNNQVKVILDSSGPLIGKLNELGVEDVCVSQLAVVRRVNVNSLKSLFAFLFYLWKSVILVRSLISSYAPDIVYVNTLAVISPLIASIGKKVTVVHHLHEIQQSPKFICSLLYSFSGALSDIVVCVSDSVRNNFIDMSFFGKSKAIVVNNGLPDSDVCEMDRRLTLSSIEDAFVNNDGFLIAYVARLHFWKGQLEFLDVVKILKDRYGLKFKVAFYGDVFPGYESIWEELKQKADCLNISSCINFFGFRRDAAALFSVSDVSIMGSVQPDPLPTIVLESMQQGTPVIGYGHGGICEMIENNYSGIIVPPCDKEMMADAIYQVCANASFRNKLGDNAKSRFQEKFSVDSFICKLSEAIGVGVS
ncbi:glycosyltransferase [Motiliproteus sp. SC1-56]|uniref:glycosyltransferase n=1 Tax=Motiliproteus sp. SC1-56 TaxID=2799565 RepID=UPI001A8FD81E|nr:glycosyltransferase [Motiliproteus sp. SC1-56]